MSLNMRVLQRVMFVFLHWLFRDFFFCLAHVLCLFCFTSTNPRSLYLSGSEILTATLTALPKYQSPSFFEAWEALHFTWPSAEIAQLSHDWLWQTVTNDEKLYLLFRKYIDAILAMRNIWRWSIQTNWWSSDICLSLFEGGDRLLVSKFRICPCLVYSYHMTKRWQKVTRWWKIVM